MKTKARLKGKSDVGSRFGSMWLALIIALLTVPFSTAQADPLYSVALSPHPGSYTLNSSDGLQVLADSFSLANGGIVSQVSWYGSHVSYDGLQTDPLYSPTVQFFSGGATPGALLIKDSVSPTQTATTHTDINGVAIRLFTATIPSFVALPGEQYYFSVTDHYYTPDVAMFWSDGANSSGGFFHPGSVGNVGDTATWFSTASIQGGTVASQAFTLYGSAFEAVPEPKAWLILAMGFGALGGAIRYRRSGTKIVVG